MSPAMPVVVDWDTRTDKGGRDDNQDAVAVVPRAHSGIPERGWLMVVCDGVGGEAGGHLASARAAEAALMAYYDGTHGESPRDWLDAALKRAHLAVLRAATMDARLRRMSTTLVAAAIFDDQAYIAHVGDSRAYLFHDATLQPLTRDHRNDATNSVTRSLGAGANHDAEFLPEPLRLSPGDRLMLCTDGVYDTLDDATMAHILCHHRLASDATVQLLEAAIQRGADDNVSVAVFDYGESAAPAAHIGPKRWIWLALIGLIALLSLSAFAVSGLTQRDSSIRSTPPARNINILQTPAPRATENSQPASTLTPLTTQTAVPTFAPIIEQTRQAEQKARAAIRATNAALLKTRIRPTATPEIPTPSNVDNPPQPNTQPPAPPPPTEQPTASPTEWLPPEPLPTSSPPTEPSPTEQPPTEPPPTEQPTTPPTEPPPTEQPIDPPLPPTDTPVPTDSGDPTDLGNPRNGG